MFAVTPRERIASIGRALSSLTEPVGGSLDATASKSRYIEHLVLSRTIRRGILRSREFKSVPSSALAD